jgi:hypothetical protein
MRARLAVVLCLAVVAASAQMLAHHSFAAEFDAARPITVTGTVTKVEWANPHTWFFVDVKDADGTVVNWGFELAGPAQLLRLGWKRDSMKVGDVVTVQASRARDGSNQANARNIVLTNTGQRLLSGPAQVP